MKNRTRCKHDPDQWRFPLVMTAAAIVVISLCVVLESGLPIFAQSPAVAAAPVTFEAASVKPTPPDSRTGIDFKFPPGRFVASKLTLEQLIEQAYGIQPYQLTGGTDWIRSDRFDVIATTGEEVSRERAMLMLQALLADRFKLQISREAQPGTVYALTAPNARNLNPPADATARSLISTVREDDSGVLSYHWDGHNATMAQLALNLTAILHAPVTDQTGLKGNYDFRINYSLDSAFYGVEPDPRFPTLITAIESQLGLKVTSAKGPLKST